MVHCRAFSQFVAVFGWNLLNRFDIGVTKSSACSSSMRLAAKKVVTAISEMEYSFYAGSTGERMHCGSACIGIGMHKRICSFCLQLCCIWELHCFASQTRAGIVTKIGWERERGRAGRWFVAVLRPSLWVLFLLILSILLQANGRADRQTDSRLPCWLAGWQTGTGTDRQTNMGTDRSGQLFASLAATKYQQAFCLFA